MLSFTKDKTDLRIKKTKQNPKQTKWHAMKYRTQKVLSPQPQTSGRYHKVGFSNERLWLSDVDSFRREFLGLAFSQPQQYSSVWMHFNRTNSPR